MLSIILYGRNDNYGYNLHKRAALSLNCMAELLDADGDEILFVDYNTPDDHATFPEAIRDTLTRRAKRLLRILRVRPEHHVRFRERTHLIAVEPISRNVALRRSRPTNRWVLSTNTDMIFVPRSGRSISAIADGLEDALYHLPRFELPGALWEDLDRMDPARNIAEVARCGWELHLNEIVYGSSTILYDGPGDFQLATRADLFRINGFDERMLLGWHVDSNLARRLGFLHGPPRSLVECLLGYHCEHTRQVTPAHRHDRIENNWRRFVTDVDAAAIAGQAESWGLASETIEEIRLDRPIGTYAAALRAAIGEGMREPSEVAYREDSYDTVAYDARHVLCFLVDALSCYPRDTVVGWVGADADLLERFAIAWRGLGFTGRLLVPDQADRLGRTCGAEIAHGTLDAIAGAASVFVIDFGSMAPDASETAPAGSRERIAAWFKELVTMERKRLETAGALPRRFIAVNAMHGRFELIVQDAIAAPAAPLATHMRQGFVIPTQPWYGLVQDAVRAPGTGSRLVVFVGLLRRRVGLVLRYYPALRPLYRLYRRYRRRKQPALEEAV